MSSTWRRPTSVKSTETLKKSNPLAGDDFPENKELLHPLTFNADKRDPLPSFPNKCDQ